MEMRRFAMHNGSVFQISASAYRNMSLKVSNLHLSSKRFLLLVNYVTKFYSSAYILDENQVYSKRQLKNQNRMENVLNKCFIYISKIINSRDVHTICRFAHAAYINQNIFLL